MKIKNLALTALLASLTFVSGFIAIPIGPVPITLQTLLVLLTAYYLPAKEAFMAMIINLVLKIMVTGPQVLLMPSAGFLYGFALGAFLGSHYIHTLRKKGNLKPVHIITFLLLTSALPYTTGLPFMAYVLNVLNGGQKTLFEILKIGLLPFVFGDLLKIFIAYATIKRFPNPSR